MPPEEHRTEISNMIEVPAPTPWPFVTAFGLALLLAGLVTSLGVSVVGFLVILFGAVGWFRDVLPMPKEELVALVATPTPIFARSSRKVDHLQPGAESHRVYIPVRVHPYSAGLFGALSAVSEWRSSLVSTDSLPREVLVPGQSTGGCSPAVFG